MKMLFVTSSLSGGGAERVMSILINYYFDLGNQIEVVSLVSDKQEYKISENIKNHFIAKSHNKFLKLFERYFKLKKIIKNYKPDIIISFMAEINLYTLLCSKKNSQIIISERNDPNLVPHNKFIRRIRNKFYKKAKTIVFQTKDAREYFKNISDENCVIIPNPVMDNLPDWNPDNNKKYIFSAGRLADQKNFPLLINAFSKFYKNHSDYKLIIAGEGQKRHELEELINSLHLNNKVELIGFTKKIHEYMAKSQMFIQTSNYEGISNVLLESLSIGVPTIATNCPIGGSKMLIKNNENGILIPINDVNSLLDAMNKFDSDVNFRKKISNNAKKTKDDYSIDKIITAWDKIIDKTMKRGENK